LLYYHNTFLIFLIHFFHLHYLFLNLILETFNLDFQLVFPCFKCEPLFIKDRDKVIVLLISYHALIHHRLRQILNFLLVVYGVRYLLLCDIGKAAAETKIDPDIC
jgi:hypothetical protein